jgi:hypothetical protein
MCDAFRPCSNTQDNDISPVYLRELDDQRHRDAGHLALKNVIFPRQGKYRVDTQPQRQ